MSVVTNADEVAAWLEEIGAGTMARVAEATAATGALLLGRVQSNIRARYQPAGGTYGSSWDLEVEAGPVTVRAVVGTNHPGARRDEFGFHGTTADGKHVSQPPRPAALPALDEVAPLFFKAIADAVG